MLNNKMSPEYTLFLDDLCDIYCLSDCFCCKIEMKRENIMQNVSAQDDVTENKLLT